MAIKHRLLVEISAKGGRALTYDRLPQGVWRERSRGDVRPMRTIASRLRRQLGDDADDPTGIFTEPGVGYRMTKGESQLPDGSRTTGRRYALGTNQNRERTLATAQTNENVLYEPDESPPHLLSLGHGFQNVITRLAGMAATTAIIARAGGQSESYLLWIFFGTLVICGLGTIAQTFRFWRFGSGYALTVTTGTAFIAVCISALMEGGPAILSSLIVVSALTQFAFISKLALLRRIITPVVAGTVLMLVAATVMLSVLGRLSDAPAGAPLAAAPTIAGVTLAIVLGLRMFGSPAWQQWSPVIGILAGCAAAAPFGIYDFGPVSEASWVGIPQNEWPGFDLSLSTAFWALLPGFVILNLATAIISISDTVTIQQVAWRRPRATDFRVVQGAHNLAALTNLLAAALGTLPNALGRGNSSRILLTGVAARRIGVYAGAILVAVAFSPKLISLVVAIPRPALMAYLIVMLSLLLVQGMRTVLQDRIDARKATAVGVSLWVGVGFQANVIFPDILGGTLGTLLGNGVTTGSVSIILLIMLMGVTAQRSRRLNVELDISALPKIDVFLRDLASKTGWNEASSDRLRSAGEETLASLLTLNDAGEANDRQRLTISARRADGKIELEFMATAQEENLEDKLAYLGEQPEIQDEREISFRLLRHYASSVQHRKYHNIDIITVQVAPSS